MNPASAAADVATVLDALAPRAEVVVGMSFGGLVATALSSLRPDLVRRIVLVDVTPAVNKKKASKIIAFVSGPAHFNSFEALLARTVEFNPTRSVALLRRGILHNVQQRPDGTWVWRHARFRQKQSLARIDHQRQHDPEAYAYLWDALGACVVPCLLVRGMRAQ